jgi:hypothetical protein
MRGGHTDWCARDHRCGLGEHRSEPLVVDLGRAGRIVATRVRSRTGAEWLDVRHSLRLNPSAPSVAAARLLEDLAVLAHAVNVDASRVAA